MPGLLFSQQAFVHPPALGFVFDSHALRPILGVPGASLLGTRLDTGLDLADAIVSPNQAYALAAAAEGRALKLVHLTGSGAPISQIDGAIDAPDIVALSPTGAVAVLYRASDGLLQVLTGMPDSPHIAREISAGLNGVVKSIAISDDAHAILAAFATQLLLIPADGIPRPMQIEDPISAISFRPRTHDAILASRDRNHVLLILGLAEAPSIQSLAAPGDGILDPLALAFSGDGTRAFVANSSGNIVQYDSSGTILSSFSCQCRITGLHRLAGNAVFRLTDLSDSPPLIFDGDSSQPRVLFIPAASEGGANDVR